MWNMFLCIKNITHSLYTNDEKKSGSEHEETVEKVNIAKPIAFKNWKSKRTNFETSRKI